MLVRGRRESVAVGSALRSSASLVRLLGVRDDMRKNVSHDIRLDDIHMDDIQNARTKNVSHDIRLDDIRLKDDIQKKRIT